MPQKRNRKQPIAQRSKPRPRTATTFPKFGDLPKEIRMMIWEETLPGSRIVHLKAQALAYCSFGINRISSNWSMPCRCPECQHWTDNSGLEVADIEMEEWFDDDTEGLKNAREGLESDAGSDSEFGSDTLWGFRTKCPPPTVLFVCRESYEVASKVYTRAFGTEAAFPTTWFNFEEDILYINIGTFDDVIGSPDGATMLLDGLEQFSAEDLRRVKNLAIYVENSGSALYGYELWLNLVLMQFGNVKKLTIIAKHSKHSVWENGLTESQMATLEFIPPIDIGKTISQYIQIDPETEPGTEAPTNRACVNIDMELLERLRLEAADGSVRPSHPWDMPIIEQKVILSTVMKNKLEMMKRRYHKETGSLSYFDWLNTPSNPRTMRQRIRYEVKIPRWWYADDWEMYADESQSKYLPRDSSVEA